MVALGLVACSSATDSAVSAEAANTEGRPLTVQAAPEWARCWFDVVGSDAQLSCSSPARANDPLGTTVEVTAATMGDPANFRSLQKTLDREVGGTVVLGTLPRASFPVMLMLHASAPREGAAAIGAERIDLWQKPTVARAEALPASAPAVMKQPFDLWPAAFIDATEGQRGFSASAEYSVAHPGMEQFLGETSTKMAPAFDARAVAGKVRYFAAPSSGPIALKIRVDGGELAGSLPGPGYYAVTATGTRPATTEEIARAFPGGADAPTPPPPADPQADAGTDAAPPVVDTDPTCGGPGQSRCAGGACDDGTRYDRNSGKCVACGNDGQTFCYDDPNNVSGNTKCNGGTRYDRNSGKCVACGNDGQTFCYDDPNNASGNTRCNDGTRYDRNSGKCVACGGDGQTFCYDDPNNASGNVKCNPGLRYNSSTGRCVPQ